MSAWAGHGLPEAIADLVKDITGEGEKILWVGRPRRQGPESPLMLGLGILIVSAGVLLVCQSLTALDAELFFKAIVLIGGLLLVGKQLLVFRPIVYVLTDGRALIFRGTPGRSYTLRQFTGRVLESCWVRNGNGRQDGVVFIEHVYRGRRGDIRIREGFLDIENPKDVLRRIRDVAQQRSGRQRPTDTPSEPVEAIAIVRPQESARSLLLSQMREGEQPLWAMRSSAFVRKYWMVAVLCGIAGPLFIARAASIPTDQNNEAGLLYGLGAAALCGAAVLVYTDPEQAERALYAITPQRAVLLVPDLVLGLKMLSYGSGTLDAVMIREKRDGSGDIVLDLRLLDWPGGLGMVIEHVCYRHVFRKVSAVRTRFAMLDEIRTRAGAEDEGEAVVAEAGAVGANVVEGSDDDGQ